MRSIGFNNKNSAYATQDYALKERYLCRLSEKETDRGTIYFVWVDRMTIEQSEKVNDFARKMDGLLWLSTLRDFYNSVNRAYDEFYD